MAGLYYAILAAAAVPLYVFSVVFKEKKNKVGSATCYVILFLLALLFI